MCCFDFPCSSLKQNFFPGIGLVLLFLPASAWRQFKLILSFLSFHYIVYSLISVVVAGCGRFFFVACLLVYSADDTCLRRAVNVAVVSGMAWPD